MPSTIDPTELTLGLVVEVLRVGVLPALALVIVVVVEVVVLRCRRWKVSIVQGWLIMKDVLAYLIRGVLRGERASAREERRGELEPGGGLRDETIALTSIIKSSSD